MEILKDQWGISHIYAETEHDLFLRKATVQLVIVCFSLRFGGRGNWDHGRNSRTQGVRTGPRCPAVQIPGCDGEELQHYHPNGVDIIGAFVHGVNAFIDQVMENPEDLPLPFKLLGIEPKHWTEEVVISRHQGLLGNIGLELNVGRAVCAIGEEQVRELQYFHLINPI